VPVVAEGNRLDTLRQLGLSDALVRLSAGERLHPLFEFRCQGPPFYSYHDAGCPEGPPVAPLWDCGDSVTGVWVRNGRLEFIEFGIEGHGEYTVLAHTEQGLWATVFADVYEDEDELGPEDLRDAARAAGFRFLDRLVDSYGSGYSTLEARRSFLRGLVGAIDGESAGT
jgi:hypothetical protein